MATELIPPKPVRLELAQFPAEPWAKALVGAINQFAQQVVAAFNIAVPVYRELKFKTGANVADSFPIVFPVAQLPKDVQVAGVTSGDNGIDAITPKWQPVTSNGALSVSVNYITGLSANTAYSIRLRYQ